MATFVFSDEPMVRNEHPDTVIGGMQRITLFSSWCYIVSNFADTNFGDQEMIVGNDGSTKRILIFPVGELGDLTFGRINEKCNNVLLEIFVEGSLPTSMILALKRMLVSWQSGQATWNERATGVLWAAAGMLEGTDYSAEVILQDNVNNLLGSPKLVLDVTSWGKDVCDEAITNQGIVILTDSTEDLQLHGLEAGYFQAPKLISTTVFDVTAPVVQDKYIRESSPTSIVCAPTTLLVNNTAGDVKDKPLLQFDVSSIPSTIKNPTIYLRLRGSTNEAGGGEFEIYPILVSWVCAESNWTLRSTGVEWGIPGMEPDVDYDTSKVLTFDIPAYSTDDYIEFDITSLAIGWIRGTVDNFGLMYQIPDAFTQSFQVFGTNPADTNDHPVLRIEYQR